MSSTIGLILEMISLVISNSINTLISIVELFIDLLRSLGFVSGSGPLAFVIAVLILGGTVFFLWKFFIGSLKTIILLFIAGVVILTIVFALA